jgi:chromosome condensin MukBEF complex kleisin-like MukF subunit
LTDFYCNQAIGKIKQNSHKKILTEEEKMADNEQQQLKQRIQVLLNKPTNNTCADCEATTPTWASTNLQCFLCIHCSGVHRSLGTHITKIKSCTLDDWTIEVCVVCCLLYSH